MKKMYGRVFIELVVLLLLLSSCQPSGGGAATVTTTAAVATATTTATVSTSTTAQALPSIPTTMIAPTWWETTPTVAGSTVNTAGQECQTMVFTCGTAEEPISFSLDIPLSWEGKYYTRDYLSDDHASVVFFEKGNYDLKNGLGKIFSFVFFCEGKSKDYGGTAIGQYNGGDVQCRYPTAVTYVLDYQEQWQALAADRDAIKASFVQL